jgi:aminoglycoside phosphotransferase (APT) family kinase protein
VAADLPLAVPDAVLLGRPSPRFPWPWTVVRWIDGGTADVTAYDDAAVAGQLVGLLRALHRPAPADAPANAWRGVPLSAREHRHAEALSELGHPRADALRRELHVLARVPGPRVPRTWVHGDLHPRNLVVRDRRLVGLIDWGDVHGGDPAVDLASVWMLLPVALHDVVRERLAVDDDTWQRARGWALVLGVMLLRVAAADGDDAFAAVGERTLERACP